MKLAGLIIKNYKRIGANECRIRIDDIVVLIGQNNAGKSTVLDAYETFSTIGSPLSKEFFHNEDVGLPIEITGIFTEITPEDAATIGAGWQHSDPDYGDCIKVKCVWREPNKAGVKQSFKPDIADFVDGGVGGWDTLIKSRIPTPVRIRPTDSPEITQTKIIDILKGFVKQQLKDDPSRTGKALTEIERLTEEVYGTVRAEFDDISTKVSRSVSEIFPGSEISIVPRPKDPIDEKILCGDSFVKVATASGSNTPLLLQGTGIQRALLWSALSVISDLAKKKPKAGASQTKILLIDEPEAFLHPPTIRSAREALYAFALNNPDWQVIATTHSPVFIDLSKEHTTIVRVDPTSSTERFVSTEKISFGKDEKERLRMIRACNPMVNEFFFYDEIVLVEGETEQVVLSHTAQALSMNIHVINCLGKGNIPLFARILNHFKVPYTVIHDSDTPKCRRKSGISANGMWTVNTSILTELSQSVGAIAHVQIPNFEGKYFGGSLSSGKVDNALEAIASSSPEGAAVIDEFKKILQKDKKVIYTTAAEFDHLISAYVATNNLTADELWQ